MVNSLRCCVEFTFLRLHLSSCVLPGVSYADLIVFSRLLCLRCVVVTLRHLETLGIFYSVTVGCSDFTFRNILIQCVVLNILPIAQFSEGYVMFEVLAYHTASSRNSWYIRHVIALKLLPSDFTSRPVRDLHCPAMLMFM